ncbi:MAG TPA: peroxiredoxin [Candidatus Thermoplasmatota archaeon]|nr:peroxiredoxin [Candidatus Thermoplasmatota archaeon]
MLKVGDAAPDFELPDDAGSRVRLSELAGKWVVLFFYPADETPGCVAESCEFRDRHSEFVGAGAVVFGVSRDEASTHASFRKRLKLPFPLLTDTDGKVLAEYQAIGLFGYPKRITYVIDPDGAVAGMYESQVRAKNHTPYALGVIMGEPVAKEH